MALRELPWWLARMGSRSEEAMAFQVEINALEDMFQVEKSITTAFEDFDFVVESLNKSTVGPLNNEIGDLLPPVGQSFEEIIKATHSFRPV